MKRLKFGLKVTGILLVILLVVIAVRVLPFVTKLERYAAQPEAGYHWPYYVYVSSGAEERAQEGQPVHLLVLPPNSGQPNDNFSVHQRKAWLRLMGDQGLADDLGVVALLPIFPRNMSTWQVYTHALDRDCLTTDIEDLKRLDLQLLAMVDQARADLKNDGMNVAEKILLKGFSANGMFSNRLALLHPERVLASAAGSPGGWPLAPVAQWEGTPLTYPAGISDLEELTGQAFDADAFGRVHMFVFMGDQDENDSIPYGDGYDDRERNLLNELVGETPIARWDMAEEMYASTTSMVEFKLYPGVGHDRTDEMNRDIYEFLKSAIESDL